jgi:hypothetical protein
MQLWITALLVLYVVSIFVLIQEYRQLSHSWRVYESFGANVFIWILYLVLSPFLVWAIIARRFSR